MFSHAVAAAAIVADLNLLADAVMAALLFAAPDLRARTAKPGSARRSTR